MKRPPPRAWWACALLIALAASARAQSDLSRAQMVRLDNGLRLLLVPDSSAAAVEVASWFESGSTDTRPGFARLLERMVARGHSGPARRVAAEGGTSGFFSSHDLACFFETLPAGSLELGFEFAAERMASLTVSAADLDLERTRLRAERQGRDAGGPASRGLQRLYAALFPGVPYRLPPVGSEEDIARVTVKECEDAFRARFGPERALVTVVGRFDPEPALRAARARLGAVASRGRPSPPRGHPRLGAGPAARSAATTAGRRATEKIDLELRLLFLGWRAPAEGDSDAVALDLLGRVLGSGSEARLARDASGPGRDLLLPQGGYDGHRDAGLVYAFGAVRPGADSAEVERDLAGRIERMSTGPVTTEELERVRRQAESGLLFGWQTVHGRTVALGTAAIVDGDFRTAWSRLERLRRIAPADLQRAAARSLKSENRATLWLVPSSRGSAGTAGGGSRR